MNITPFIFPPRGKGLKLLPLWGKAGKGVYNKGEMKKSVIILVGSEIHF
jgi:hypothetical protein